MKRKRFPEEVVRSADYKIITTSVIYLPCITTISLGYWKFVEQDGGGGGDRKLGLIEAINRRALVSSSFKKTHQSRAIIAEWHDGMWIYYYSTYVCLCSQQGPRNLLSADASDANKSVRDPHHIHSNWVRNISPSSAESCGRISQWESPVEWLVIK